jgi:hypothetical protein
MKKLKTAVRPQPTLNMKIANREMTSQRQARAVKSVAHCKLPEKARYDVQTSLKEVTVKADNL